MVGLWITDSNLLLHIMGASYPSGRMVFVLELRENAEWRILEWYDYPNVGSE